MMVMRKLEELEKAPSIRGYLKLFDEAKDRKVDMDIFIHRIREVKKAILVREILES